MERRSFIKRAAMQSLGLAFIPTVLSFDFRSGLKGDLLSLHLPEMIAFPDHPDEWSAFRDLLSEWRKNKKESIGYDGSLYDRRDFQWVSSAYNCYFLMMYDELFYNRKEGKYTVERFLEVSEKKFGRLDIVVLWHAYPRIGLDDRNQFDFYKDMPGGLSGIHEVADQFHQRNIKVYINYNPWDTGTRREQASDIEALTEIIKEIDADGIFLDTMAGGAREFREKLDNAKPGVVLESELALPAELVFNHHMSWAQWFPDGKVPGILRNKWIERRHMQHGISRWERDRSKELHTAWMNGSGIMIWENVFGQWVGWNERDQSILRTMSPIQKRYSGIFSGEDWTPMAEQTLQPDIFVSRWSGYGVRLWTVVNRSENEIKGDLIKVDQTAGDSYFDLIAGKELVTRKLDRKVIFSGRIQPRGIACFVAGNDRSLGADFKTFLYKQAQNNETISGDTGFPEITTVLKPFNSKKIRGGQSTGMVKIPAFNGSLEVTFRVREVGFYRSVDPSFVNIGAPALHHEKTFSVKVNLPEFLIDETPVTNAQYAKFLKATGYEPASNENFLKHWNNGEIPEGKEDHPVVYVDLDDARAYAAWIGKRLPTEHEWQFAGQGFDSHPYPWGTKMEPGFCNSGESGDTSPVKAFPSGKSVFGCYDLCGNAWELTESEYSDGRNHFCILKGGSFYQAKGSEWYFDGGPKPMNFAAKQLLIYPGIDRCSTIGFRCAADL